MIERITILDKEAKKGVDITMMIHNGRIVNKHIDYLIPSDWGELNG